MRSGGEGHTSLEATIPEESIIIISDDETDVSLGLGNSVLFVEDANEDSLLQEKKTLEVLDEEIAITFSRKAHVMPHARYDCSTHPFSREEQETQVPIEKNASFCDECYCYLCDKPASECSNWTTMGYCHCNAHKKSKYWKDQRDLALVGVLTIFDLDLTEIDSELKEAGNKLQLFLSKITPVYNKYLEGTMTIRDSLQRCVCSCHRDRTKKCIVDCTMNHVPLQYHNYTEVYKTMTDYLDQVEEQSPKAAAVMLLGAAKELVYHKALSNPFTLNNPVAEIKAESVTLMTQIVSRLQRLMVVGDYPRTLYDKFVSFFQSLPLPPHFYSFTSSLNVMRWDNCLLTSVLAGQNLTGTRTNKGKKECLWEALPVVQARVQKLEGEQSYRPLVRYLNAVGCPEYVRLNFLKQKLCFYMCKYGDFMSATHCLLQAKGMKGGICKSFTPAHFELHLTMLRARCCPAGNQLELSDVWIPQNGVPLKKGFLLRTALRILYCNNNLFHEAKCWSALVRVWCTSDTLSKDGALLPLILYEPDKYLQQTVMGMSCTILDELLRYPNVNLPEPFQKSYSGVAELILIVQAVVRYMMATNPPLTGTLELIAAFGPNHWALSLLIDGISPMRDLLYQFVTSVNKELYEDEQHIVELFISRGPKYVTQLVPVFLLHPNEGLRTIGFHFTDVVLTHMARFPWAGALGNCLTVKVVPFIHPVISPNEHQKLMANIAKLTGRS